MKTDVGTYETMKAIFNSVEGVDLHEKKGGRFFYTMYLSEKMEKEDIDALELSVRARNGLRRADIHTVGELAIRIAQGEDIRKIRNCGAKSYSEIMEKLFMFNLVHIPEKRREQYILDTIEKNKLFLN